MNEESASILRQQLGLREGDSSYFAHAPKDYFDWIGFKTYTHRPDDDGTYKFIHAFFTDQEQITASFSILSSKLSDDGVLWISVPVRNADWEDIVKDLARLNSLQDSGYLNIHDWDSYKFVVA